MKRLVPHLGKGASEGQESCEKGVLRAKHRVLQPPFIGECPSSSGMNILCHHAYFDHIFCHENWFHLSLMQYHMSKELNKKIISNCSFLSMKDHFLLSFLIKKKKKKKTIKTYHMTVYDIRTQFLFLSPSLIYVKLIIQV